MFKKIYDWAAKNFERFVGRNGNVAVSKRDLKKVVEAIVNCREDRFNRRVLDMDGTIIDHPEYSHHSSWARTFESFGPEKKRFGDKLKAKYYGNKDPRAQSDWVEQQGRLMKGEPVPILAKNYLPGFGKFVQQGIINGHGTYINTTGVQFLAEEIKKEFSLDDVVGNEPVVYMDGCLRFTGQTKIHIPVWDKKIGLYILSKKHKFNLDRVVVVGDADNDIGPFEEVRKHGGMVIAINTVERKVKEAADFVVRNYVELQEIVSSVNQSYRELGLKYLRA